MMLAFTRLYEAEGIIFFTVAIEKGCISALKLFTGRFFQIFISVLIFSCACKNALICITFVGL